MTRLWLHAFFQICGGSSAEAVISPQGVELHQQARKHRAYRNWSEVNIVNVHKEIQCLPIEMKEWVQFNLYGWRWAVNDHYNISISWGHGGNIKKRMCIHQWGNKYWADTCRLLINMQKMSASNSSLMYCLAQDVQCKSPKITVQKTV